MDSLADQGARQALDNARDLSNGAELLFNKRRYARSFALSVLSVEETGKSYLYKLASLGDLTLEQARRISIDHSQKLGTILLIIGLGLMTNETFERME